jgi:hypothetical protein
MPGLGIDSAVFTISTPNDGINIASIEQSLHVLTPKVERQYGSTSLAPLNMWSTSAAARLEADPSIQGRTFIKDTRSWSTSAK